jgi:hypothetical protein
MLWFTKRPQAVAPAERAEVVPAALPVTLDPACFQHHFARMLDSVEGDGGIEACLAALGEKQRYFAAMLDADGIARLDMAAIERLLDRVFTARRRLYPALERHGAHRAPQLVRELLGPAPLGERLQNFVDAMPGAEGVDRESMRSAAKVRRAARDFAAELLHFADPVRYPLMCRWVWDTTTQSGAVREFVRGGEAMRELPFGDDPGLFESVRSWLAERIAAQGIYRDVPFWIDLVLAQAYTSYMRAVTDGSLGADFGRGVRSHEQLKKLLGIDTARGARPRVRKTA